MREAGYNVAQRSDAKARMVQAAEQLIRERGHGATAFADVLERSGASRGSVYFHFPGGKSQLVTEAAEAHARRQVAYIDEIAGLAGSPAEFVTMYLNAARDGMVASGYSRGCGIAPLIVEDDGGAGAAETSRRAFADMTDRLAVHLVAYGMEPAAARELAEALLAALEGALVTARALRSPAPFDSAGAVLAGFAAAGRPGGGGRQAGAVP
ncbi:MAG TPA: helix-turn-helix domain-containing protein [Trebonia sp.]|jgi:AcrR family transcriptional regulator|nr:helix-turn-helix domain-containing protein [Trebonia sp.]